uniref:Glycoprotein hormone beta-5 n=1 Tax=Neogobius melanostomus TaxID=47308 RepID=A0A8C6UIG7_9GOBI
FHRCLLLFLLLIALSSSALNLRRFTGCAVREFTFMAKKPGCGGLHVTTDACWGRCETWEPIVDPPYIESFQRVCTYNESRLVTVRLPHCLRGVDPTYTFPSALRCECGLCLTRTTECETASSKLILLWDFFYPLENCWINIAILYILLILHVIIC